MAAKDNEPQYEDFETLAFQKMDIFEIGQTADDIDIAGKDAVVYFAAASYLLLKKQVEATREIQGELDSIEQRLGNIEHTVEERGPW